MWHGNFSYKRMYKYKYSMIKNISALLIITSIVLIWSCSDEDGTTTTDFDRAAMLESIATNLIIPNFEQLNGSVQKLSTAANQFVLETTEENLASLQAAWQQSVTDHQHCSAFGFGPASLNLGNYDDVLAIFPVDEVQVEANMLNEGFNLSASFDRDVRGFFAIEYLIFGKNQSSAEIVASFDQTRKDYLLLIVDELETTVATIVDEWNTSYLQEFIANDGTSAGSSVSLLYNEFVKNYENLKNFKVELPAGLTAGQTGSDGTLVEAFYSGISRALIIEHFQSSINIWMGQSKSGENLIGFEEYLETVIGGPELIASTKEAIQKIDESIANLPQGSLSENVEDESLITLRDELQSNTANFKSSMSSLLGISITFNSGDGD